MTQSSVIRHSTPTSAYMVRDLWKTLDGPSNAEESQRISWRVMPVVPGGLV